VSALPARERPSPGWHAEAEWAQIEAAAPRVAAVMRRYLRQLGTFLAPRSVDAADSALRQLARWMITEAGLTAPGDIRRDDIEDYKVWLAAQPRGGGQTITKETHRQRMRTIRQFFERIIEAGLARRTAAQPGHRLGHPHKTRTAAEVPRRPVTPPS
jgi:site-specific recombinase XerD